MYGSCVSQLKSSHFALFWNYFFDLFVLCLDFCVCYFVFCLIFKTFCFSFLVFAVKEREHKIKCLGIEKESERCCSRKV